MSANAEALDLWRARLRQRAVRILTLRQHCEAELREKLQRSLMEKRDAKRPQAAAPAFPGSFLIDEVVEWCRGCGWLDDSAYAQSYIRHRSQRGYGPRAIRYDLLQRGVAHDVIDTALQESEVDWSACAQRQLSRKFSPSTPLSWQQKGKMQSYLHQRGFSTENIRQSLANFTR